MNELQLALLAAGVVAIVAVWIYNAWQERKHRKLAEAIFKGRQDDVLMPPDSAQTPAGAAARPAPVAPDQRHEWREPTVGQAPEPAPEPASVPMPDARPGVGAEPSNLPVNDTPAPAAVTTGELGGTAPARLETGVDDLLPWADPLADCLVELAIPAPMAVGALWVAQSAWSRTIAKPVRWLARNGAGDPWTPVDGTGSQYYQRWLASLQLVNRTGPASEADLVRFYDGMQQLARQTGASIDLPARGEMLLRAQDLDRFCANVDVQFGVSVVNAQGNAFAGTKLRGVCEAAGLSLAADGLYHYCNAAGEREFTLANLGNERFDAASISTLTTHGVTLTIDVPRVADGTAAFNRLIQVARQLALGLGGTLVDANRAPLSEPVIATIRGKIGELQAVLGKAGIVPGSPRALRLFS